MKQNFEQKQPLEETTQLEKEAFSGLQNIKQTFCLLYDAYVSGIMLSHENFNRATKIVGHIKTSTASQPDSKEGLHTQGEWNNNLHDGNVYGSNGIVIANCYSSLLMPATIKANAELIVKSVNERKALSDSHRELLENLGRILDRIGENGYQHDFPSAYERAVIALNNAKNI